MSIAISALVKLGGGGKRVAAESARARATPKQFEELLSLQIPVAPIEGDAEPFAQLALLSRGVWQPRWERDTTPPT